MIVLLLVIAVLAAIGSIAALINTHTIIRDLSEIKEKLGIKEIKKPSFLDKDLDN